MKYQLNRISENLRWNLQIMKIISQKNYKKIKNIRQINQIIIYKKFSKPNTN